MSPVLQSPPQDADDPQGIAELRHEEEHQAASVWGMGHKLWSLIKVVGIPLFFIVKLAKLKFVFPALGAFVSIGAYTLFWGLPFAVGLVALLFIHEMGHVLELRRLGIKASAPMFIPFLGAMIAAKEMGKDAFEEARVGLAGPIVGTLGTLGALGIYYLTGNELFQALAYFGFFLNLINLLPILPLDGGRAMAAVSPWLWAIGFVALIPLSFVLGSPIFLIIVLLLGGFELFHRFRARHTQSSKAYHQVSPGKRLLVLGVYLALVVGLLFGMEATYIDTDQLQAIQDSGS